MGYFSLLLCGGLLAAVRVTGYNIDTRHPLIYSGNPGSFFGYSVALLNNSQGSWVLSGAPKSQSVYLRGIKAPGALFRCPLHKDTKECEEVLIDDTENVWELIGKERARPRKDNQWLGASMDIKPSFETKITVCAPHWSDAKFRGYHYLVNGMCFEMGQEFDRRSFRKLHPLVVKQKQVHKNGTFIYGSGMAGFAAYYAQDESLLLGAPGVNDWKGGVIRHEQKRKSIAEKFSERDGYAGYSLSSGRLYRDQLVYYVTGAPGANGTGLVYIISRNMEITSKVPGQQTGEGFGSAVAVVDVNGDGLDDLIIGAPQHSETRDEGRAYVFTNKDLGIFRLSEPALVGTNAIGGRFGAAISSLGDVDIDGFPDIVIGAPFEEDGAGSIYIYNGYDGGMRSDFSQRITGRQLGSGLRTFGASFSRVHDIDGNTYGDFAVGSFLSDNAVVLRGIPVINLEVQIKFSVKTIDLRDKKCEVEGERVTCFTVTVCFQFDGSFSDDDIEISYNLTADTMEKHVSEVHRISLDVKGLTQSVTSRARLTKSKYKCNQHRALAFESQDIITPVKFAVSFGLSSFNNTKKSSVHLQPVMNKHKSKKASKQILYVKNCGTDNICMSDLQLETQLNLPNNRDYLISGEDSYISHQITVTNLGERAYLTTVAITYPSSLQYVRVTPIRGPRATVCTQALEGNGTVAEGEDPPPASASPAALGNHTLVVCDVGNPVRSMETVLFVVKMFVDSIAPEPDPLQIRTVVRTASRQRNTSLSDNSAVDYLLIRLKAGLIVTGISSPEQIRLLRTDLKSQENKITERPVSHVYEVGNLGPSSLPLGTMYLTVVLHKRLKEMIRVARLEVIDPVTDLVKDNLCALDDPEDGRLAVGVDPVSAAPGSRPKHTYSYLSGNLIQICDTGSCISGHCTIRNLRAEASIHVRITVYVKNNVFVEIQDLNLIHINSSATFVEDLDPMYIAAPSSDRYNKTVATVLYTDVNRGGVSLWALIASLASGVLVILVIIILLCRGGFFRRKKKEELVRLIEERESESGSRLNTIEHDNEGLRLQPIRRRHDVTSSDSSHYEEPVLPRNSGVANGHGSRAMDT